MIVARDALGRKAVLVGELDDNPGTTVTNAVEQVAEAITQNLLHGDRIFDYYQYVPKGLPDLEPTFYRVDWQGEPGRFSMPGWTVVEPQSDPWLRHLRDKVKDHGYTLDALTHERGLELVDAREREDLPSAI